MYQKSNRQCYILSGGEYFFLCISNINIAVVTQKAKNFAIRMQALKFVNCVFAGKKTLPILEHGPPLQHLNLAQNIILSIALTCKKK